MSVSVPENDSNRQLALWQNFSRQIWFNFYYYFEYQNPKVSFVFCKFASEINKFLCMANRINRIKVVLAEKGKTGKWLAEELKRDKATVSKWCTNRCQPDINTFLHIAKLLEVDIRDLFNATESE